MMAAMTEVMTQAPQKAESLAAQPLPSQLSSQIDLLISLKLWSWPALTFAIQNSWGGSPQVSADKRDWFAGAISELLTSTPPQIADVADLEEVLLQVMLDEFEVVVDDDSPEEVARSIWKGMEELKTGDLQELNDMYTMWARTQQQKGNGGTDRVLRIVRGEDKEGEETDWDDEDDEDDDEAGQEWNGFSDDVSMQEAPSLADTSKQKQKVEPEIDEDGFTKVRGKKRR